MQLAVAVGLHGVTKRFGDVVALAGASLELRAGEVHVVLGENGAGKSSLISVAAGLYVPDAGRVEVGGRPVSFRSPADALARGIVLVPQHPELVPNLTCWENVILGHEGGFVLSRAAMRRRVAAVAAANGIDLPLDAAADRVSAGEQLKVELLKMLHRDAQVLILDEPTTFLTPQETDALYATLEVLTERGIAVVLVTHKLRDALRVGSRLSVMRAGAVVATLQRGEADEAELIRLVTGSAEPTSDVERAAIGTAVHGGGAAAAPAVATAGGPGSADPGDALLIEGLCTRVGVPLRAVSLRLAPGEIRGLAGVAGNGQRELADALLGIIPASAGTVAIAGTDVTDWPVARRRAAGLGVVPEDRLRDGILPSASVWENFALGSHRQLFGRLLLRAAATQELTARAIERFDIRAPGPNSRISRLSGGNIQKVIVARALHQAVAHQRFVLLALYPTRGLDVGSAARVWDGLRQIAAAGGALLVVSEDLDEMMAFCATISVLYRGALVAELRGPDYSRYAIGEAMLGHRAQPAAPEQPAGG